MTPEAYLVTHPAVQALAELEAAGGSVEVNERLPYIAIDFGQGEGDYFFQGQEAEELLAQVPEDLSPEEYFAWVSRDW
jgi:hypothetical protein